MHLRRSWPKTGAVNFLPLATHKLFNLSVASRTNDARQKLLTHTHTRIYCLRLRTRQTLATRGAQSRRRVAHIEKTYGHINNGCGRVASCVNALLGAGSLTGLCRLAHLWSLCACVCASQVIAEKSDAYNARDSYARTICTKATI